MRTGRGFRVILDAGEWIFLVFQSFHGLGRLDLCVRLRHWL